MTVVPSALVWVNVHFRRCRSSDSSRRSVVVSPLEGPSLVTTKHWRFRSASSWAITTPRGVRTSVRAAVEKYSESLPFLVKRPQLKGYVGDVGFDPLGFSEILPMVRSSSAQQHAGV